MKNRKLLIAGMIGLLVYILYFFMPGNYEYPLGEPDPKGLYDEVNEVLIEENMQPLDIDPLFSTQVEANESIGRYIDHHQLNQAEVDQLSEDIPLYSFMIETGWRSIEYDPVHKALVSLDDIAIQVDEVIDEYGSLNNYLNAFYDEAFTLYEEDMGTSRFVAPSTYEGIHKYVDVFIDDGVIRSIYFTAEAEDFPTKSQFGILLIAGIYSLLFFLALSAGVTVHAILVRKEIRFSWLALLLSLVAGAANIILTMGMLGIDFSFLTAIDAFVWMYNTFLILLIRFRHRGAYTINELLLKVRDGVKPALLWGLVSLALTTTYFFVTTRFFGSWVSPVDSYALAYNMKAWMIPLVVFAIGFSAAIFEETIFRHYMVPLFDRFSVIVSMFATSILWGVLHISYDMYPWYLYIVEFIIITGPLFYVVYKRYGFTTSILLHYFYNAWVMTLFAFAIDLKIGLVSLLVMLFPVLALFVRPKA